MGAGGGVKRGRDLNRDRGDEYIAEMKERGERIFRNVSLGYTVDMLEGYLTTQEAAEYLGTTANAIRKRIDRGEIEGVVKAGRDWFIPLEAAEAIRKREQARPRRKGRPPKTAS